jgi:hypothetical protein
MYTVFTSGSIPSSMSRTGMVVSRPSSCDIMLR